MDNREKFGRTKTEDVFLIVDENEVTQNIYATLGMAIDAIEYNARRIMPENIRFKTKTSLEWGGRDDKHYGLFIKVCPICKDVTLDYMDKPRDYDLFADEN